MNTRLKQKPKLSFWDIWNMSFGFLGVQMGFALQNANASRILQTFGADVEHIAGFWLVAPITGMIVQPIIGHYSDQTWTKLGRRRPFFLVGAILAALGLILMPNASMFTTIMPAVWIGAGFLMMMDASFNIAMEPFRALVADKLPSDQRTLGFSIQTVLIGIGAVIGSWLPYVMAEWFGVSNTANNGEVPLSLVLSFVIGAIVLVCTIIWTVAKTSEYTPEQQLEYMKAEAIEHNKEFLLTEAQEPEKLSVIFKDIAMMPKTMKQLGIVQFFSWFALFSMWVFTTTSVAQHVYGLPATDTSSEAYNEAANWVGIMFGVYNGVSAIFAFFLPTIAHKIGRKMTHTVSLIIGGIGLLSIYFIKDPNLLLLSMIGVGVAWASILAMPYAILSGAIPAHKMGVYMGIFNLFITIPQITNGVLNGIFGKYIIGNLYGGSVVYALITAAICLFIAAFSMIFVKDVDDRIIKK